MAKLNISQAAKAVGVSRSTFYRHVESKGISTTKDADGNPLVDTSELIRVYGTLQDTTPSGEHQTRQRRTGRTGPDVSDMERKLYELQSALDLERVRLESEQARREQVEAERDKWQAQAERALLLLTDQRAAPSLWERLFGKRQHG